MISLVLGALVGIAAGRLSSLVPGSSASTTALILRSIPGPIGAGAMVAGYVSASLATAERDAQHPELGGGDLAAWSEQSTPVVSEQGNSRRARREGLVIGLGAVAFGGMMSGFGLLTFALLGISAAAAAKKRGAGILPRILLTFAIGRLALYTAGALGSPFPVLALGASTYALPAVLRSAQTRTTATPAPTIGETEMPALAWAGAIMTGVEPGLPSGLVTSLARTPAEASKISGIADGLAISNLAQGMTPRSGVAVEAAFTPEHAVAFWVIAAAVAIAPLPAFDKISNQIAESPAAPSVALVITLLTIGLSGGLFAPIAIALGLLASAGNKDTPEARAFLFSAPTFIGLP